MLLWPWFTADVFHLMKQTLQTGANQAGSDTVLCIMWPLSKYWISVLSTADIMEDRHGGKGLGCFPQPKFKRKNLNRNFVCIDG